MSSTKEPVLTLHGNYFQRSLELLQAPAARRLADEAGTEDLDILLQLFWRQAAKEAGGRPWENVTLFTDGSFRINYDVH